MKVKVNQKQWLNNYFRAFLSGEKKRLNDLGAQLCLRFRFWLTVTYHKEAYKSN